MSISKPLSRRQALVAASATAAVAALPGAALAAGATGIRAIAFDGFPIFDPRSVAKLAVSMFPEQGATLAMQWANKLFGYTWIVTSAAQYQDFRTLADLSLQQVAGGMGLTLTVEQRAALVGSYETLTIWTDVPDALEKLRSAGVRLAFLSNLSADALNTNMKRNHIDGFFEAPLSTDRVRRYKPAPEAYAMGLKAFALPKSQIGFAAFGGWDAAGAGWFGYRTAWINRLNVAPETIGPAPAIVAPGIDGVLALAGIA